MKRALIASCIAMWSAGAYAEVTENVDYVYYDVAADNFSSLEEAINASTPLFREGRVFHGYTKWNVHWHYRWYGQDDLCRITNVNTDLTVTITLPRLIGGTESQRRSFEHYLSALSNYLAGYHEHGKHAAAEIDHRIFAMPAMSSCTALEKAANHIGHDIVSMYGEKDRKYARETQYGTLVGVVISD